MITRPLDLAAKLRPAPRSFDFIFLINGGLIALFFTLFSSHFVLSPGLRVGGDDFQFPTDSGRAIENAVAAPISVSVNASGQMFVETGLVNLPRLREWLGAQAKLYPGATVLVIIDARVSTKILTDVSDAATAAGLSVHVAVQPVAPTEALRP